MNVRLRLLFVGVLFFALVAVGFTAVPAKAADPGEQLINSSGSIPAGSQQQLSFYTGGPANIRFAVSGGAANDSIKVTIQGVDGASWTARTGETVWGYTTLPSPSGILVLKNTSSSALSYSLQAYALDIAPKFGEDVPTLTGVAQSGGTQSAAQVTAPTSGLYQFSLEATKGSYQLRVDSGEIWKTVVSGKAPKPSDSIYYLSAGVHTLTVVQGDAASTEWSIGLTPVGGVDALPSSESAQQIGGGSFFGEEHIPLQIAADQPVNIRIATSGATTDKLTLELYNGAEKIFTSSPVFGGETTWVTAGLTEGANSIHVVAAGNTGAMAYNVQISAVSQVPVTWKGTSYGSAQHNGDGIARIRLVFPSNGLYTFTLGADAGRYQFLLGGNYVRKTVTTAGVTFTAFVPGGAQTLQVVQDPAQAQTTWSVAVAASEQKSDALPFATKSSTLGGAGNAFTEEWIPVYVTGDAQVNMRLAVNGAAADAMKVEIYNADAKVYSADTVYGTEVFWGSTALAKGRNLIHVVAPATNAGKIAYDLVLYGVASIPSNWAGISRGAGLQSTITLNAPVDGTYQVVVTVDSGSGQIKVDSAAGLALARGPVGRGTVSTLRVPLKAGTHSFVFAQDSGLPSTTWAISTSLRKSDTSVAIGAVSPGTVALGEGATVTVTGQNFGSDTTVALVGPDGSEIAVTGVVLVNQGQLTFTLPTTLAQGSYGVKLTSGGVSDVKAGAISVGQTSVFLPLVSR